MWAKRAAFSGLISLAACSGNPWIEDDGEPDSDPGAIYGEEIDAELTMNSMVYDPDAQQLVVNNMPFDGATAANGEAIYARVGTIPNSPFERYENVDGSLAYYAVFRQSASGYVQAGAAATSGYTAPGIGGVMVKQTSGLVSLPGSGEYTFTGEYAAVRVIKESLVVADNTVPQYVTGDAEILLDFGDFDEVGAITGTITNRQLFDANGNALGPAEDYISFATTELDRATGKVTIADAFGINTTTDEEMTSGDWTAILGGPNGEEIAGIVVLEGSPSTVADSGTVRETGVFIAIR